ncbi:hypothetical protein D3C83_50450 [compost metagenome]
MLYVVAPVVALTLVEATRMSLKLAYSSRPRPPSNRLVRFDRSNVSSVRVRPPVGRLTPKRRSQVLIQGARQALRSWIWPMKSA